MYCIRTVHRAGIRSCCWSARESRNNRLFSSSFRSSTASSKSDGSSDDWKFGMVGACSRHNGIIGVNGSIPWPRIPKDRQLFKRLTRNRILIIGRKTLEERWPQLDHIDHCFYVIVVSRTVRRLSDLTTHPIRDRVTVDSSHSSKGNGGNNYHKKRRRSLPQKPLLRLARSLDDALELARSILAPRIVQMMGDGDDDELQFNVLDLDTNPFTCWVAGGEDLYREALGHVNASELHLSTVDFDIEVDESSPESEAVNPSITNSTTVARFPDPSTWSYLYRLISETKFPSQGAVGDNATETVDDENSKSLSSSTPSFTYRVYRKVKG